MKTGSYIPCRVGIYGPVLFVNLKKAFDAVAFYGIIDLLIAYLM